MQFKDYYQTLGVAREATADEIKKAFRRLARKYHPDLSKEAGAELRMKEINEAYAVLSDPEKRAAYDALSRGHRAGEAFRPPPDWDAGFEFSGPGFSGAEAADFSDFFAELFGRMGGGAPRGHAFDRGAGFGARGEDHHAKIVLDIEDAWRGAQRQLGLRVPQVGAAGDLLLEVHFRPHPRFKVSGRDLLVDLPVAPWEAALGSVLPVPLPDGSTLKVRIPAGAQSGRQLVVRGKGIPATPPGDLELTLRVVLPPADTPRARALYEKMASELRFDPRAAESL